MKKVIPPGQGGFRCKPVRIFLLVFWRCALVTFAPQVKRSYAFEMEGIPREETEYFKVSRFLPFPLPLSFTMVSSHQLVYPARFPAIPADTSGETFSHIFGTHTSSLENFILKRDLMGPGWIKVRKFCIVTRCVASGPFYLIVAIADQ